jgi:uncharacterized protein YqjF (DUF2071 family)
MTWHDLLFMHWPVPASALRPLIPRGLELDTFSGCAWLGVVPFNMRGVRPRGLPSVPPLSHFPELNVRTYVTAKGVPGVWFFSLDAANPVAVRLARASFHLPYFDAKMACRRRGDEVRYESVRTHRGAPPAAFRGRYRPLPGTVGDAALTRFLTERYCLYSAGAKGQVWRGDVHHLPWPLRPAEVELETHPDEMTRQLGLALPDTPPLLHFSARLEVLAWLPRCV